MTLRQYLILMSAGAAFSWTIVGIIMATTDPNNAPLAVFVVFYIITFMALTETFSVIGFFLRTALLRQHPVPSQHVAVSLRQSLLLSMLVMTALFLLSRSLLNWTNIMVILFVLTIMEFFLISAKKTKNNTK